MSELTHLSTGPSTPSAGARELQPLLHDLATAVAAPGLVLSAADGQIGTTAGGVAGWYVDDVRLLSRLELTVAHSDLDLVRADITGTTEHSFAYVARSLGDIQPDPTVLLERRRRLHPDRLEESVRVTSTALEPVRTTLRLAVEADLQPMPVVKRGVVAEPVAATVAESGLAFGDDACGLVVVADEDGRVADGALSWDLQLEPGETREISFVATAVGTTQFRSGAPAPWSQTAPVVSSADARLARLWRQSLADLEGLLLREDDDRFLAAGSPWFLTLFGRDSLWAARLLLPLGTDLALSTLRVLARRQGVQENPETEEQPGKILHEIRNPGLDHSLPPLYYGTVDATPLFVCLLADAAKWGADPDQVRELLPAARRCLQWVLDQSRETGWLRYVDQTGRGLSNQGWKDSHDSVQFADGRLAQAPIALCEVQAYAHEAAVAGAALLAAYGEPEVPGLLHWAADLRTRFAEEFWVETPEGGHLAIALDAEGRQVDSVTSNMGHVLGTGILSAAQAARTAELLTDPALRSGFGVRTLTSASPRFSRLSYHGGSVWPHDSAVAIRGLAAEGHLEAAVALSADLVRASEGFAHRFPELYGGDAVNDVPSPTAYPAACRPQAWSAAAAIAALVASTGLEVDVPKGRISTAERTGTALGAFRIDGLRAGAARISTEVDLAGAVHHDVDGVRSDGVR